MIVEWRRCRALGSWIAEHEEGSYLDLIIVAGVVEGVAVDDGYIEDVH